MAKKFLGRAGLGLLLLFLVVLAIPGASVQAQTPQGQGCSWGNLEVPLPNVPSSICSFIGGNNPLGSYARIIANLIIALIVALGLIVVVVGGFRYMTAGGDASKVQQAKGVIIAAMGGIALALASYIILNTISTQFTGGSAGGQTEVGSGGIGPLTGGTFGDDSGLLATLTYTGGNEDLQSRIVHPDGSLSLTTLSGESFDFSPSQTRLEPEERGEASDGLLFNDADCVSITAPEAVGGDGSFTANVTMLNTGTTTWFSAGATPHRLGSAEPHDTTRWSLTRVDLPSDALIAPDEEFTFAIVATPNNLASGSHVFAWQMLEEGHEWFGETCRASITLGESTAEQSNNTQQLIGLCGIVAEECQQGNQAACTILAENC